MKVLLINLIYNLFYNPLPLKSETSFHVSTFVIYLAVSVFVGLGLWAACAAWGARPLKFEMGWWGVAVTCW
jgi:hypothetical protein